MRTLEWDAKNNNLKMIDQRLLPGKLVFISLNDHHRVAEAIRDMVVRGAPAIGVAAAFGMALAAQESPAQDANTLIEHLQIAARELQGARPTAVNLQWAVERILRLVEQSGGDAKALRWVVLQEAQRLADEDLSLIHI